MDVMAIDKVRLYNTFLILQTGDKFRLLYDTKGRFVLHKLKDEDEVSVKLCKVRKCAYGPTKRPYISTHDGRTIGYPDPNVKRGDTVVIDTDTGKATEWLRFKPGCVVMVTGGANIGRVGEVVSRERHPGSFDMVYVRDAADNQFATRLDNCFVIGASLAQPLISLPKQKGVQLPGVRLSVAKDRELKLNNYQKQKAGKEL